MSTADDRSADIPSEASLQAMAFERAWLKLLHYVPSGKGWESQADAPEFFLHPDGKKHPELELRATFEAFNRFQSHASGPTGAASLAGESGLDEQPPCRFPARWMWMTKTWPEATRNWVFPDCEKYRRFAEGTKPDSVTLVFASYYLNNPSSAFGHTFIRLNRERIPGQQRYELLDYGINYAATVTTENPIMYALSGLFGWFKGDFTSVPYYYKIQEYNNMESRDLWEYDLNLSKEEIALLVAHFWELGQTYFDYFYLSENCSYHMLTSLEAAAPRLNLVDHVPFYVIPVDTVKVLRREEGLVGDIRFRPSRRSQFVHSLGGLSGEQKRRLAKLVEGSDVAESLTGLEPIDQAAVADAAIEYLDFKYFKQIVQNDPTIATRKQQILVARSRLGIASESEPVPIPEHESPFLSHPSGRAGLLLAADNRDGASVLLAQRFALHDLLDAQSGYPRDAEISFLDIKARARSEAGSGGEGREFALELDQFYLFGVRSYGARELFLESFSWEVRLGAETLLDQRCDRCLAGVFGAGVGLTYALNSQKSILATGLVGGDTHYSPQMPESDLRASVGPKLNVRWILTPELVAQVGGGYQRSLFVPQEERAFGFAEARWAFRKLWAFNFKLTYDDDFAETQAGLYYYY